MGWRFFDATGSEKTTADLSGTDHGTLTGLADDDHTQYLKEKVSGGAAAEVPLHSHADDTQASQVPHTNLSTVGIDDHHNKNHNHDGLDGSGTVNHSDTTGKTANDHHNEDHASRHAPGGADPLTVPPVGTVVLWTGDYNSVSAPTGWLYCDGSAVSRTTYAALFAVVSTNFGVGDGSTTFNLPNLTGKFPLGQQAAGTGHTLGSTGGSLGHTHAGPSHTHSLADGSDSTRNSSTDASGTVALSKAVHTHGGATGAGGTGATGTGDPPWIALPYIIKT